MLYHVSSVCWYSVIVWIAIYTVEFTTICFELPIWINTALRTLLIETWSVCTLVLPSLTAAAVVTKRMIAIFSETTWIRIFEIYHDIVQVRFASWPEMTSPATSDWPQITTTCRYSVIFKPRLLDNHRTDLESVDSFGKRDSSAAFSVVWEI